MNEILVMMKLKKKNVSEVVNELLSDALFSGKEQDVDDYEIVKCSVCGSKYSNKLEECPNINCQGEK
jgi:hypothetical protein